MGKLSNYKRIITSDFQKEDQKLVEALAGSINDGFNQIYFTMSGRIDLRNNIFCTVRDIDITVNANGNPINQTTFSLDREAPVIGCQVILALNQVNSGTYPTGAPFISFTQLDSAVLINNVTGLQANQRYTLRIVAYN